MAVVSLENIRLSGLSACVPLKEYDNNNYELLTDLEKKAVITTTGVEKRRVAGRDITTSDMCEMAAKKLFEEMPCDPSEIDLLIFVSQSRDYPLPCTAIILQDKLGIPKQTLAFDVPLGCSGYVYGLYIMGSLLSKGELKKGLLLVGDISSNSASYFDQSSFPLFGDAGTATILEYKPGVPPMWFNLQSDGSGWEAISIPEGGIRNYHNRDSFKYVTIDQGIRRNRFHLVLDGIEIFNFALREVTPNIKILLKHISKTIDTYDYCFFHQANKLINETLRKMLRLPAEKVPYTIHKFGNTSSASIPLTMVSEIREELTSKPLSLLMSGFGVGLSWGSVSLNTDKIVCPALLEYPNLDSTMPQE